MQVPLIMSVDKVSIWVYWSPEQFLLRFALSLVTMSLHSFQIFLSEIDFLVFFLLPGCMCTVLFYWLCICVYMPLSLPPSLCVCVFTEACVRILSIFSCILLLETHVLLLEGLFLESICFCLYQVHIEVFQSKAIICDQDIV